MAYRKLFEALARERPLLLVLEDIHWAEPTLLDLIEHVVEWTREAPLLILCLARAELLDQRPGWRGDLLELEALAREEAESLVLALAGDMNPSVRAHSMDVAEGNPLFLEQLIALAGDENGQELVLPQTIHALLTARLDQLESGERELLERAAVVGKEFWRAALGHLSPPGTEVSALLQRLVRRRMIRPEPSSFPGEDAFLFGHILIRDAAYAAIGKERRAELHEALADWLEASASPYDEIIGYHLEQAYRYHGELGPAGERERRLARRAAEALSSAGIKARARDDRTAATNLCTRAVEILPRGDRLRVSLLADLGDDFFWLGRYADARSILAEAVESAQQVGDRRAEWHARLGQSRLETQSAAKAGSNVELERTAREALAVFEEIQDNRGLAKAHFLLATALEWQYRHGAAAEELEKAAAKARLAGDEFLESISLAHLAGTFGNGPTPFEEAITRVQEILASASTPVLKKSLFEGLAYLFAAQARFSEARSFLEQARGLEEEFGSELSHATFESFHKASVELDAGNLEGAEGALRRGYEVLERLGEQGWRASVAARLAGVLVEQGRLPEAEYFLEVSEGIVGSDDIDAHASLCEARGQLLAKRGKYEEAARVIREGSALLEDTDDLVARASMRLVFAEVLWAAGNAEDAKSAAEEALRFSDQKGHVVIAREAQALLDELAAVPRTGTPS